MKYAGKLWVNGLHKAGDRHGNSASATTSPPFRAGKSNKMRLNEYSQGRCSYIIEMGAQAMGERLA